MLVLDVAHLKTPPIRSYPTGMSDLDGLLGGGVSTRQLLSVLGPPGAGKSAWAVATALHAAPTLPVLYVCSELEAHELMARTAANLIDRPWSAIVRGTVPMEWVYEALAGIGIHLIGADSIPRQTDAVLRLVEDEAAGIARHYGTPPLVIVDFLQDLARGSEREMRGRVGDLATDLRAMSQRLDCPMVAISSVARSYYNERRAEDMRKLDDPTVYLAAAKESGDVDYASAAVMFLDVEKDEGSPTRAARIAVAKSRHGRTGFAGARFVGSNGRWLPEAGAVAAMSASGRTERVTSSKNDEADAAVVRTVKAMLVAGQRELCTGTYLRESCGIGKTRVPSALARLKHTGRLRLVTIEREEGGKVKQREIYEPGDTPEPVADAAPDPQHELDLDTLRSHLHGGEA